MEVRYSAHPLHVKRMTTDELRNEFLAETIFSPDELVLTYSHVDRIVFGGALPIEGPVDIEDSLAKEFSMDYFLEGREMGIINIGGKGRVEADGEVFLLEFQNGLYLGRGTRKIRFISEDKENPAKFYLASVPAHKEYPARLITLKDAAPATLGEAQKSNRRTIYKFLHPQVLETCQLSMGLTRLEPGSVWNTMPCHTHERRMEVYFYTEIKPDAPVFHFMGQPGETRHLVVRNDQAVISPSWSIHSGVGTGGYTFIWAMCGENKVFDDMDFVPPEGLR